MGLRDSAATSISQCWW